MFFVLREGGERQILKLPQFEKEQKNGTKYSLKLKHSFYFFLTRQEGNKNKRKQDKNASNRASDEREKQKKVTKFKNRFRNANNKRRKVKKKMYF